MLGNSDGNLTVDVSLIGLTDHLINEVRNVGSDSFKLWSVVEHDTVGHNGAVI